MQDVHDYTGGGGGGGGGGMFFSEGIGGGGGGGGGDRRMRSQQNNILNHHHHQSLKCPRCNSLNTKFCYYNNYNLSQPRHFCKNCRRYWTKGGVLRNVPVGGGCRKAKRSKSKQVPSSPSSAATAQDVVEKKSSSSESSSLTASNSTVAVAVTGAETAKVTSSSSGLVDTDMNNLKLYGNGIEWSTLLGQGSSDGGVFSEIGGFTTPFRFGGNSVNQQCIDDDLKLEAEQQKFGDRTAEVEIQGRSSDPKMGFEPLDWGSGGGGDQTLFDLTSTVDHAYWSQSQWTTTTSSDQDHDGLYLP